jgi:alkylated DNA nucleotide flippase Atl1
MESRTDPRTYDAVARAAGGPARSVGRLLGDRSELAWWVVVNSDTGHKYQQGEYKA